MTETEKNRKELLGMNELANVSGGSDMDVMTCTRTILGQKQPCPICGQTYDQITNNGTDEDAGLSHAVRHCWGDWHL